MRAFREMALRIYNHHDDVRHVVEVLLVSFGVAEAIKFQKARAIRFHGYHMNRLTDKTAKDYLFHVAVYHALLAWWVISKLRRRPHALSWLRERGATYNLLR